MKSASLPCPFNGSQKNYWYFLVFNLNRNQRIFQVVQKLIPQLPTLENLLNIFVSNSQIEKAFLFDVVSKVSVSPRADLRNINS